MRPLSAPSVLAALLASAAFLGGAPEALVLADGNDGAAGGAGAAGAAPYEQVLEAHRKKLKTDDPDRAVAAVQMLDPSNPRSMPELLGILARWHWRVRGAAIEALAKIPPGPLRSELRLHLVSHADPWVRDGVAYAMTLGPVPGDAEALAGGMDDADWRVRRTSARGLGEIVSKEGVARLIRAVEEEKDLRVSLWVRASLRGIAREDFGRDAAAWKRWWQVNRDRADWKKQGEEILREEFAGVPLERITIDRPVVSEEQRKERDSRPELVVLSPFGWSHGWFRPYLDEASEFVKVVYVSLPSIAEMTGQSGYGGAVPQYPVERFSKALEEMRKRDKRDKLLLLGAGPVGWIVERYALDYPERVAGLVVVDGWLDSQAYAEALARLTRDGSPPERRAAATLLNPGRRDAEESRDLRVAFLTAGLTDIRDSEAFRIWRDCARDHGFASVPPLQFDRHVKIRAPTLFTFADPEIQPFSGGTPADFRRIRDSFKEPPPILAVMRETKGMGHVEQPEEFLRVLRGFLEYANVKKDPVKK